MTRSVPSVVAALVIGAVGVAVAYYWNGRSQVSPVIVSAPITRGDVVETVDATGRLQAVTTVQVGTQVSGTIKTLRADFNQKVRKGQVIAELEPSLFETQVEQARASLVRLQAEARRAVVQRDDAEQKLGRARELAQKQLIPASDLETADTNARAAVAGVAAAEAQIVQARASLNQTQVNLDHTIIRAPIDGVVISRNVDVGQTVAASMQAPTLFVLAQDLTAMQVNANVAESDIGRIAPGQAVRFRVDAYSGVQFSGTVSLVRLDPIVDQNVVSYVTTIDVPNPDLSLKPGMTASVTIEIERASAVLRVPNAALRVKPSAEVLTALGQVPPADDAAPASPSRGATPARAPTAPPAGLRDAQVWTVHQGHLTRVPVRVGISDASYTAVIAGGLNEGDTVVTNISLQATGTSTSPTTGQSPLLPAPRRPPGAGGAGTAPRTR